ncbi:MAG: hypothetical protein Q4E81_03475, partial [Succinatimonas sp.]|nr:hypothetical protein [Succinatimonas sp.]
MISYENMLSIFIVTVVVCCVLAYNLICIKVSLKYDNKVLSFLEKAYNSDELTERQKDYLHWQYTNIPSLVILLVFALVMPFYIIYPNKRSIREEREK